MPEEQTCQPGTHKHILPGTPQDLRSVIKEDGNEYSKCYCPRCGKWFEMIVAKPDEKGDNG